MSKKSMTLSITRTALLLGSILGLSAVALPAAADLTLNNDQVLAVRHAAMRTNSAFNGLAGAQDKGNIQIPADQLKAMGEAWARYGELMPALWPEGSGMDKNTKSKAKPEIWTNAADFKTKVDAYTKATAAFREAANKGDAAAVKTATADVGKSCQGCHETYRAR